jgi:beta-lactamase class A
LLYLKFLEKLQKALEFISLKDLRNQMQLFGMMIDANTKLRKKKKKRLTLKHLKRVKRLKNLQKLQILLLLIRKKRKRHTDCLLILQF